MTVSDTAAGGNGALRKLARAHARVFGRLEHLADAWLLGLGARLAFVAVLAHYYLNSALTKLGPGLLGIFHPSAGAFAQIVPPIAEHYSYNTEAIPFFPWHVIVILGSVSEITLPVLIAIGALTRVSAIGMMVFISVQTFVDASFHGVALGGLLGTQPGDVLAQRLLWLFPLLVLVMKGSGAFSVDAALGARR